MQRNKFILNIVNFFLTIVVIYISNLIVITDFDDNESYSLAFKSIEGLGITEAYLLFSSIIGGGVEPIYFLLNYTFKFFVDFNFFIILINLIFLYYFYKLLKTVFLKNHQLIYAITITSSNLIIVLLSDVHRLKVAYLFFMVYLCSNRFKNLFLIISLFSHFQMVAFIIYSAVDRIYKKIVSQTKLSKNIYKFLLLSVIFSGIIVSSYEFVYTFVVLPLEAKLAYYMRSPDNTAFFNMARFGGIFGIYMTYLLLFKLKDTFSFVLPIFFTLFSLSIILNLYRLNLVWLLIIFIIEINRLSLGKKFAIVIVAPLLIYNIFYTSEFIWRGLSLS